MNQRDPIGLETVAPFDTTYPQVTEDLHVLSDARHYHEWLYSCIKGALGSRIIEVGAGIGNYTPFLLTHGAVRIAEPEPAYAGHLRRRFGAFGNLDVEQLALGAWTAETRARVREFRPDTFVCLNVLEHVVEDEAAVAAMYDCLEPGGHLALVLPALGWLFSALDERYGHYRRYGRADAARLVRSLTGASIPRCHYLNAIAVPAWWINHVLLKREGLPKAQTKFFDRVLVPLAAAFERVVPVPFGLSLVLWIRKQ